MKSFDAGVKPRLKRADISARIKIEEFYAKAVESIDAYQSSNRLLNQLRRFIIGCQDTNWTRFHGCIGAVELSDVSFDAEKDKHYSRLSRLKDRISNEM